MPALGNLKLQTAPETCVGWPQIHLIFLRCDIPVMCKLQ